MPIYEYRCQSCQRKYSMLHRSFSEIKEPVCTHCGSDGGTRLVSQVTFIKSWGDFMNDMPSWESMTDFDEDDPRSVADMLKTYYMERHLGTSFPGVISGMNSAGFFITLGELPIDGFLPVTALPEDRYHFDPESMLVTSEGSKKRWSLGTPMDVCVVRVDVETRQIELGLSDDPS